MTLTNILWLVLGWQPVFCTLYIYIADSFLVELLSFYCELDTTKTSNTSIKLAYAMRFGNCLDYAGRVGPLWAVPTLGR